MIIGIIINLSSSLGLRSFLAARLRADMQRVCVCTICVCICVCVYIYIYI